MLKRIWAFALSSIICMLSIVPASAATLGPASSFSELKTLLAQAEKGDTVLLSGDILAEAPLTTGVSVYLRSDDGASISGLRLHDASVTLSSISLLDSLQISGTSHVHLGSRVLISGADSRPGLSFYGNGTLIIEPGCTILGGSSSAGVSISHTSGEFFSSIEGNVTGGSGQTGGAGLVISPLNKDGAVMITGAIAGGNGVTIGGHALNLYDLSGNAYVTIDGRLSGGPGAIGGDGIQLVSATDSVNVGVNGRVKGGQGSAYGGDALILMNADDASSFRLSGMLSGGDVTTASAQPGTSLQLVGHSTSLHTRIDDCILEDGKRLTSPATPVPQETPAPTATPVPTPAPVVTPLPEIELPSPDPVIPVTPMPTIHPDDLPAEATPGEAIPETELPSET